MQFTEPHPSDDFKLHRYTKRWMLIPECVMMMLSNANLSNWVHLCIYGHGHTLDFVIQHHPLIQMCSFQLPMHKDILDLVLNKIFLQRD